MLNQIVRLKPALGDQKNPWLTRINASGAKRVNAYAPTWPLK